MAFNLLTNDVFGTTTMNKKYFNSVDDGKELIFINGEEKIINSSQKWFWTEEWQAGEKKVDAYIAHGKIEKFDSMEEFLTSLEE